MAAFRRPCQVLLSVVARRPPVVVQKLGTLQRQFLQIQRDLELARSRLSDYEIKTIKLVERTQAPKGKAKLSEKQESDILLATREISDLKEKEEEINEQLLSLSELEHRDTTDKNTTSILRHPQEDLFMCMQNETGNWQLPESEMEANENFQQAAQRILEENSFGPQDYLCLSRTPSAVFTADAKQASHLPLGAKVFLLTTQITPHLLKNYQAHKRNHWLTLPELLDALSACYAAQLNRCL